MPISKLKKLSQIIKVNGGLKQSLYKLFIHDNLKDGKKIGEDQYGNRYFENNRYFRGANRWVEYNPDVFLDYDPTMMDPEWHGYMHHRTEYVPSEQPGRPPRYRWMLPVEENPSGTRLAYTPYSTTTPKIQHWIPPALGLQEKDKNLKTQDKCEY
ncbi:hypothetical protein LSTR_LSTR011562 [Laodelphax striatellus]|uniref:NADH dehydrogenase [ubiquinone] 1 alpha subcomplex subunit 12 n=1 Tax=Laodelphax striatellus TaxID=195883 RepID=A0A482X9D6_LAOST|nr:hypothetical protein LSTR_LSTR011562 [Laodelphax striatellus]